MVQIADLYHDADQALAARNWPAAIEKLQRVLEMDPAHPQAKASLDRALQQQDLADLYVRARRHTDEKNWREAVEELRRVRETDPNFQDVKALLERARRELDREERERDKTKADVQPPAPAPRKFSTSLKVGGCAIAATVTLCSVLVVGVMLRQQSSPRATAAGRPPAADRASELPVSEPKVAAAPRYKEEPFESPAPKSSPDERALLSVIRRAANAEIQAGRSLDPGPLSRVYTGAALLSELANVQYLRSNGTYAVARLGAQNIDSFRVSPDGSRAEVQATETWTVRFVSALNGFCVGEWPTYQISHTYFLGRGGTDWMIDAIQHHNQPPAMQPCGE